MDDLLKRFVEQLRQTGGEAGVQCEDCLPLADAIEALITDIEFEAVNSEIDRRLAGRSITTLRNLAAERDARIDPAHVQQLINAAEPILAEAYAASEAEVARLRERYRFSDLHIDALSEIQAVRDGQSDQTIEAIMDGLMEKMARFSTGAAINTLELDALVAEQEPWAQLT